MDERIRAELARAMGIPVEMVRAYRRHGETYAVVLSDFRKVEGVRRGGRAPALMGQGETAVAIPSHLQLAYARPHRHTMPDLRELGGLLGVQEMQKMSKSELVAAIEARKKVVRGVT